MGQNRSELVLPEQGCMGYTCLPCPIEWYCSQWTHPRDAIIVLGWNDLHVKIEMSKNVILHCTYRPIRRQEYGSINHRHSAGDTIVPRERSRLRSRSPRWRKTRRWRTTVAGKWCSYHHDARPSWLVEVRKPQYCTCTPTTSPSE